LLNEDVGSLKILFIADIVGNPGRKALKSLLPKIVAQEGADMVIANCENAAAGFGVTQDIIEELYDTGITVLTSGNHIWDKKDINKFIDEYETLLRPANYPHSVNGSGSVIIPMSSGKHVGVINIIGRVFMQSVDCPFVRVEDEIAKLKAKTNVIFVDFHAEATSEKIAMGWFLDGKVSAVIGTHTHVQTADERILPKGTAFLCDAGMTGSFDSVIGMEKGPIIERFLKQIPTKFEVAKENVKLQGAIITIDEQSGRASDIRRISEVLS